VCAKKRAPFQAPQADGFEHLEDGLNMEAKASLRFARISIRKARTVLNMVRGKNVATALNELRFLHKSAAPLISKLLDSAIANAQQKQKDVDLDNLYIKLAFADKAPDRMMRRFRPRAMGRATRITKGMSHLHLVLDDRTAATGAKA
jgi:large subunit ribosomal protein L22